ncbi:MAG: rhodanese-like domain-containing protein, partial [Flavobacteriaceae bacterium]
GKKMSDETTDTLGHQKKVNYALRADMTKEEFIKELLTGLTTPPGYFPQNVLMNIKGYESLDTIMERGEKPLSPEAFEAAANETDALMLDTRDEKVFAKGFVPNSINIALDGKYAQWVGEMIPDVKQPILLITDPGYEEEAITRLSRVGYDNTLGYLEGGYERWVKAGKETDHVDQVSPKEFEKIYKIDKPLVFDVRKKSEFDSEHVIGAVNIPLNEMNQHLAQFPKNKKFFIHCEGGYRSMVASSILKSRGWEDFVDVADGIDGIKNETKVELSEYIAPTTML